MVSSSSERRLSPCAVSPPSRQYTEETHAPGGLDYTYHSSHPYNMPLSYPNPSLGEMARFHDGQSTDADFPLRPNLLLSKGRRILLMGCILVGLFFSCLDAGIVSTSLITISDEFQDFSNVAWIVLAYLLTYMGFAVSISHLSDIYGRRDVLLISWMFFTCFSMGCAAATTMTQLIICRAFQGIGASGLYTLAQITLVEIGPLDNPAQIGALIGLTLACSLLLGPILGGIISSHSTWRWVFNMNVPFGLIISLLLSVAWPVTNQDLRSPLRRYSWASLQSIDFAGAATLLCSCCLLVFGIQQAGSLASKWSDPQTIISLTVAGISGISFLGWQWTISKQPNRRIKAIFPTHLWSNRVYIAGLIVTFLSGFPYFALTVAIPERFQIVYGENPLESGLHLLPMLGSTAVGTFVSGLVQKKRNNTAPTILASACLQLMAVALMTLPNLTVPALYGFESIFGLGVGLAMSATTIMTSVQVKHEDLATAHGAISQARVLGGCLGLAGCTVIWHYYVEHFLTNQISGEQLDRLLRNSPRPDETWPADMVARVKLAYTNSFKLQARLMQVVCSVMVLAACFTWEKNPPSLSTMAKHQGKITMTSTRTSEGESELGDFGSLQSTSSRRSRVNLQALRGQMQ